MKVITKPITRDSLHTIATQRFGNLVKAVVDVSKEVMAIDANMHSDEEALLLSKGSKQENLWGINLYPEIKGDDFIEFDSMTNIRPGEKNMSRSVDDVEIQEKIKKIVNKLIK